MSGGWYVIREERSVDYSTIWDKQCIVIAHWNLVDSSTSVYKTYWNEPFFGI